MDRRGFPDAAAMNDYMIRQWNRKVRDKDEVVILGDFSLGTAEQTNQLLEELNGRKYLILGIMTAWSNAGNSAQSFLNGYGLRRAP